LLYIKKLIVYLISIANFITIKHKNRICFNSYPDFFDNAMCLYIYMINNGMYRYEFIWLTSSKYCIEELPGVLTNTNFKIKILKKNSLRGIYYFVTSKYIFYTHGLFNGIIPNSRQIIINLWHGMPLKKVGLLENGSRGMVASFTYVVATSELYKKVLMNVFGVNEKEVLVFGSPRTDEMKIRTEIICKLGIDKTHYEKIILWAPTYRNGVRGDIRKDGKSYETGLPLLTSENIKDFDDLLRKMNNLCIIKVHEMEDVDKNIFINCTNIVCVDNGNLERLQEEFYPLLGEADILITDYSSIYIDYLLLDRPIGFILDDISQYKETRGFIFQNVEDYMPGEKIYNYCEFKRFISDISNGIDKYSKDRKRINSKVNKYNDFNSTKRLLDFLHIS
jgi:CDP-glycerol glycerophosphotransferase